MFNKKNKEKYKPLRKIEQWEVNGEKVKLFFNHNNLVEKFMRWLIKKPKVSDIELDEMGSMVWQLCDGTKTVYDIALAMVKRFNDSEQNSIDRLIMFLRYLSRKGWITFEK